MHEWSAGARGHERRRGRRGFIDARLRMAPLGGVEVAAPVEVPGRRDRGRVAGGWGVHAPIMRALRRRSIRDLLASSARK